VEVDTTLFDETGEVDWNRLDAKAIQIVDQVFANLPTVASNNAPTEDRTPDEDSVT
jgi:hypothetical protein